MARGAGVRSEISNSVGRPCERERGRETERAPAAEAGGTERETQTRERTRGEESRKVPQDNGYQNCACHYNFKAGFPRSFSLASPPAPVYIRRVETGAAGTRQRGKGRKRARPGRTSEKERRSAWEDAATPATRERVGHLFPPCARASGGAKARARAA